MEKKLQRDENNKMLAGVAAGLAEYFGIDTSVVRLIFVLMTLLGLSGVLIYIILWIVVPPKPFYQGYGKFEADYRVREEYAPGYTKGEPYTGQEPGARTFSGSGSAYTNYQQGNPAYGQPAAYPRVKKDGSGRYIAGVVLLVIGFYFLLDQFYFLPEWFEIRRLWPIFLIIAGIMIILRSRRKKDFSGYNVNNENTTAAQDGPKNEDNDSNSGKPGDQPIA